ncbi:unnamed protein product [Arctia plantaginis]|uniref:Transcription factor 25 n=1 Tax=Arctia plantaginis TaxID=874455 RepID=A0A8S0Z0P5_ARCPL|nr:unnamed protein product [Arctia plantaginis]
MSSRNLRRMRNETVQPRDSDDSDDDLPPSNKRTTYEGLILSDDSDTADSVPAQPESEEECEQVASSSHGGARRKTSQKKKAKSKKRKIKAESASSNQGAGRSDSSNALEQLDEIDRSLMEVNEILGAPPSPPPQPEIFIPIKTAMCTESKYLNVANEMRRLFGPEDPEEIRSRNKQQPHRARLLKRVMVQPTSDVRIYDLKKTGLSMSVESQHSGITRFVYDHDQELQRRHLRFLEYYAQTYLTNYDSILNKLTNYRKTMHVEPLLEISDKFFKMEEYSLGNEIVENVVTYLQFVAHPSFDLSRNHVRLPYVYRENRPFHVAMLKYLYLLSNKACHRTALEIAKMLLRVDPSDPLAVVFIIDTLALRAREHEWLIEAVEFFHDERQGNLLFNIQYSLSLAMFHVAIKKQSDLSEADKSLQNAMLSYPKVFVLILENCSVQYPVLTHVLFAEDPIANNRDLNELMKIYAKLTWPRWREPQVMKWLLRNAQEVSENYDNDGAVKTRARDLARLRARIFETWPSEITRHMIILEPMSNLILDMQINTRRPRGSSWDPLFDTGINRYGYKAPTDPPSRNTALGGRALLYRFFTSIIPSTELDPPVND